MSETMANLKKAGGKTPVLKTVTLGTANSYDIKTLYPDLYDKLTVDNFYQRIASATGNRTLVYSTQQPPTMPLVASFTTPSLSYNATTGVLTCGNGTAKATISASFGLQQSSYTNTVACTTTTYMVYVE